LGSIYSEKEAWDYILSKFDVDRQSALKFITGAISSFEQANCVRFTKVGE